jgi:hypothetical protein
MADVIHDRLLEQIDWNPTRINSLTASTPAAIRTPVHFASDRLCLEKIAPTVGKFDFKDVTIGRIANSLDIGVMTLTENLRADIEKNPNLEIIREARAWEFDEKGDLGLLVAQEAGAGSSH